MKFNWKTGFMVLEDYKVDGDNITLTNKNLIEKAVKWLEEEMCYRTKVVVEVIGERLKRLGRMIR